MKETDTRAGAGKATMDRSAELFNAHQLEICKRTDRMFAVLMSLQWIGGIVAALWISPRAWVGATSSVHLHVWAAVFLGGAISSFPIVLAVTRPGYRSTRYTIGVTQMLMGGLLIHLTGGRLETHFHIFGSLAFLSFYRDWRVMLPATLVVAADHVLRGLFWPQSVYGVLAGSEWRWIEHAGWVLFEDIFLLIAIKRGVSEMWGIAERTAKIESLNQGLENRVADRTARLATANHELETEIADRRLAEDALRDSEGRYRLIFESNPFPLWVYDLETLSFLAVNEAAVRRYGYSEKEFLCRSIRDIHPPEDLPTLLETLSILSDEIGKLDLTRHQTKDGSIIEVEITWHELLFAGRRARLVLANDVTERRKLEVQLRQSQKMESIGQLASGIAHEINTPTQYVGDNLRFIQEADQSRARAMEKYAELFAAAESGAVSAGLLEAVRKVIKEEDLDYASAEVPKALKQSLEGVERIAKIVQSMRDFAHPGSTEKKAVDLNRAIESTINVARGEWKYVAEMVMDFDPNLPPVPCLLGELNQMTLNMIINSSHTIADKMKLEGQGKGLITISTRHEGDWAVMRVSDTGGGIPVANQARVFDPFFTTKDVGKGTGQGLAISHTVVEKHGGTIAFETVEGEGTTFIIRLPLQEIAATPDGLKEAA